MGKVGKISFYKKVIPGKKENTSAEGSLKAEHNPKIKIADDSGDYFVTVGNFRFMKYTDVQKVAEITKHQPDIAIEVEGNGAKYSVTPLYFIGDWDDNNSPFKLNESSDDCFLVSVLTLNKSGLINKRLYKSANEMLVRVKEIIAKCTADYIDENKGIHIFSEIYPCLGSEDLILIARGNSFGDMFNFCGYIRTLPLVEPHMPEEELLFRFSNSTFSVHNTYDLTKAECNNIQVVLSFAMNNPQDFTIIDAYNNLFGKSDVKPLYSFGDYDLSIYLDSKKLAKFLYVQGVRGGKLPWFGDELKEINNQLFKLKKSCVNISSRYVRVFSNCNIKENRHDGIPSISGYESLKMKLMKLVETVNKKNLIPTASTRTMQVLVEKCCSMLCAYGTNVSGLRMYTIFTQILNLIDEANKNVSGDDIAELLGNFNASITTALMAAGGMNMDYVGIGDVDTINPTVKFFYAYENMIQKLFSALNVSETKSETSPLVFLTVNPIVRIGSIRYLDSVSSKSHWCISVNIPDIGYFEPKYSFPQLAHEVGHYVNTGAIGMRNLTLQKLFVSYIKAYVWKFIQQDNETSERPIEKDECDRYYMHLVGIAYREMMPGLIMTCSSASDEFKFQGDYYEGQNREFVDILSHFAKEFCRISIGKLECTLHLRKGDGVYRKGDIVYAKFLSAISSFREHCRADNNPIRSFREIMREARADILMCIICGFDSVAYLKCHLSLVEDNLLRFNERDPEYLLRVASVLSVLSNKDAQSLRDDNPHRECNPQFLENFLKQWDDERIRIDILHDYLDNVKRITEENLNNLNERHPNDYDKIQPTLDFFNNYHKYSHGKIAEHLYSEWYEAMHLWGDKSAAI